MRKTKAIIGGVQGGRKTEKEEGRKQNGSEKNGKKRGKNKETDGKNT